MMTDDDCIARQEILQVDSNDNDADDDDNDDEIMAKVHWAVQTMQSA